ncbi:hypothetical protein PLESTF_001879100 [Pleodorina starrii]|nr:hypothetical protein PLESTF_001879100 [Pleodorina starrii]
MALNSPNVKQLGLRELQKFGGRAFSKCNSYYLRVHVIHASTVSWRVTYLHRTPQPVRCPAPSAAAAPISHATNFHLVLHAVYKNPPDAKLEQLELLEELTLQRLDDLNVDSLITVMFAFARSRYQPHPAIQARMAAATEADMASFSPLQLEHAAWSLAAVRYRPTQGWLDGFARALQVNWDAFRPSQLAVTLVQAAACGLTRLPAPTLLDQMPALLRRLSGGSPPTDAPGTLAKLVWSAGHFEPAVAGAATAAAVSPPPLPSPSAAVDVPEAAAADPALEAWRSGGRAPVPLPAPVLPERELLGWWEGEGVVEAEEPGDLVLLLHGLARLGLRPGRQLTRRLLAAAMGSPGALAQLRPPQLALLAWSALKLAPEEPLRREWLDGLVAALWCHIRQHHPSAPQGQGIKAAAAMRGSCGGAGGVVESPRGGGGGGAGGAAVELEAAEEVGGECPARPADVALVLSSLAGLGGQLPAGARGDLQAYWRSGGHWAALSREDRVVMSLLGYGPGAEPGEGPGD